MVIIGQLVSALVCCGIIHLIWKFASGAKGWWD
jgi:hypothetical protein